MTGNNPMATRDTLDRQEKLMRYLAVALEKESPPVEIFETHISWVLVARDFAYKFKKAVHFDFLDFSTLDARHFYCREELRLNRRLAPELYVSVVSVTGDPEHPLLDAPGMPIEYAVKMRAFSQQALWSHRIATQSIAADEIDMLARKVAQFHHDAAIAPENSMWGAPEAIALTADDNLAALASLAKEPEEKGRVRAMQAWQVMTQRRLGDTFADRKAGGWIRECHGDLHGGNILTIDDKVEVFDCIEFNESLRWIDVMNDIAFICMDLRCQQRADLATRFLDRYLDITGDYEGLAVLHYYQIHRALVRCKIAMLRIRQLRADAQDAAPHENQAARYLAFSIDSLRPRPTAIILMHGYSGSGKSVFSKCLVDLAGAIRIRSDVERKRMHGLSATSSAAAAPGMGLYDAAATQKTYDRLCLLARHVIESGMPVVVDAAFLKKEQRNLFDTMARDLHIPFLIFDMQASDAVMSARIAARAQEGQDPSDAGLQVLAQQIAAHDPFSEDELTHVIAVDSERGMDTETIRKIAEPAIQALRDSFVPRPSS